MHRRLALAAALLALSVGSVAVAHGDEATPGEPKTPGESKTTVESTTPTTTTTTTTTTPTTTTTTAPTSVTKPSLPVSEQEIGARLGLGAGGRVSPGGVLVAGNYLYQLAQRDWFDASVGFSFGSSSAACFRDRQDNLLCDHGVADGFGMYLAGGVRRFFMAKKEFAPYVRAGLAVRLSSYSGDSVTGFVVPLWAGGGVRARVTDGVAVVGDAMIELGGGIFSKGVGLQPHFSLAVLGGVEFALK